MIKPVMAVALCSVFATTSVSAHEEKQIVPIKERELAQQMHGPKQNSGISSVKKLGTVALADEFSEPGSRVLRSREITIEPGGKVAVHQHQGRPGLAYILECTVVEHRNDSDTPLTREVGDVAFEKTGVVHWWENKTDKVVRALVVDIVVPE